MSLRDQLLKSGLVSKDQVKKVETDKRKHGHKAKKDKATGQAEAERQAQEARRRQEEQERQRERDRQLNEERERQRRQREAAARVQQLVDSNRLNDRKADVAYHFTLDGRFVKRVWVTPQQQKLLALGRMGIARNPDNEFDFPLVNRDVALRLMEADPEAVVLLHEESARLEDDLEG